MAATLTQHNYGKGRVRVTKVVRDGDRHALHEYAVTITLDGDFGGSYKTGDNGKIVATDSMKNTVYVLAREHDFDSPEEFAEIVATHFVTTYEQVSAASVAVEQANWVRIFLDGEAHDHAFTGGGRDVRVAHARHDGTKLTTTGGIAGLLVLKTTASEFHGFVDDRYRTLPDATDRIFATTIDAEWTLPDGSRAANGTFPTAKATVLRTFATRHSLAVQQTLLQIGRDVLDACPGIGEVRLSMPNQHRIPVNLEAFDLTNENEIFVATDEPFGTITGTVTRE